MQIMIFCTAIMILLAIVTVLPAMMSIMGFDAPGSTSNVLNVAFVFSILTFPVVCVGSIILAWILYYFGIHDHAVYAFTLPLVNITIFMIVVLLKR